MEESWFSKALFTRRLFSAPRTKHSVRLSHIKNHKNIQYNLIYLRRSKRRAEQLPPSHSRSSLSSSNQRQSTEEPTQRQHQQIVGQEPRRRRERIISSNSGRASSATQKHSEYFLRLLRVPPNQSASEENPRPAALDALLRT